MVEVSSLVHWHTIQAVGNIFLQAFSESIYAGGQYKSSISTGGHLRAACVNLLKYVLFICFLIYVFIYLLFYCYYLNILILVGLVT